MASVVRWLNDLILTATNKEYPDAIHFPHVLVSVARYRRWRASEQQLRLWLFDLVASYWMFSQGGGCVSVLLLEGLNRISWIKNPKHVTFHVLGYLLVYFSPLDLAFRAIGEPWHPVHVLCAVADSVDATTTACAQIDRCRQLWPGNKALPYLISLVIYKSGSLFRWCDQRSRGKSVKTFLVNPDQGVTQAMLLTFCWLRLGYGRYRDQALVALCAAYAACDVVQEAAGIDIFLGRLRRWLAMLLQELQQRLRLGVEPAALAHSAKD